MLLLGLFKWCLVGWLTALFFTVVWKLISGSMLTDGLLSELPRAGAAPARITALTTFAFSLGGYLIVVANTHRHLGAAMKSLPDVPPELLALLGGGNLLHLTTKALFGSK